ncbi:Rieske (2Fe-2S) protein [Pseudonocardia sp. RS010]|uniref:Rieske (2Fe-2S) protein n=1 Tax=Pseudonocardia sp. RS010 TaxID=3385979 RepID=UPI00399F2035
MSAPVADANEVEVARVSELADGQIKAVDIDGLKLAVVRWDGEFFAVRDRCPHEASSLCFGVVGRSLTGDGSGVADLDGDRVVLICPWHRWEYDLRTGAGVRMTSVTVKTYPVEVRDDRVFVVLRPARAARSAGGAA